VSRKRKPLPLFEKVEITATAAEGKSLARVEDRVLFVTNAVPGDVADVQVFKKRRKYMEGRAVHFHEYSTQRAEPFCDHFGTCGGCKWQFFKYEEQLKAKHQQVIDNLERIGKLELNNVTDILPAPDTRYYRNKLEFTFSASRWPTEEEIKSETEIDQRNALGFHIKGMYDKILDIDHCHLQADPSNDIRNEIRSYAIEKGLEFFNLRNQKGFLRNLIIRTSQNGEIMVILSVFEPKMDVIESILTFLEQNFPKITSLYYVINDKKNDSMDGLTPKLFSGKEFITENMEDLEFRIGPRSFYQTNSKQAYNLYKKVREFAKIGKDDTVYDLYTGTGTIALFLANLCKKVVGVEYVEESIADAKKNAKSNDIENTAFFAGDMKDVLSDEFVSANGKPNVIITDPPRAGMHEKVVMKILDIKPERIVYVSCNPATQARDLALLKGQYTITAVQPVDMFPHTHHVENIVALERNE